MMNQILAKESQKKSSDDHHNRMLTTMVSLCYSDRDTDQALRKGGSPDPPFEVTYKNLLNSVEKSLWEVPVVEECELPLIDLKQLGRGEKERESCKNLMARASQEWGFFQVINHGVSPQVVEIMRAEQMKLFQKPFEEKKAYKDLNFSEGSYRWGTPSPTSLHQLSWSEAFHVQLSDVLGSGGLTSLSSSMEQFSLRVWEVAQKLACILGEGIGETNLFKETCIPSSCYLRLNRYPLCPSYANITGLIPHTDTSFLTVLHQDHVGGLQLVKDGKWIAVKPNPDALIINIGDLFQAWSNDLYKSVEHRVIANPVNDRFSTAYFLCPPHHTVIQSRGVYRSFSFGEYVKQNKVDVATVGQKVGLPRFLSPSH